MKIMDLVFTTTIGGLPILSQSYENDSSMIIYLLKIALFAKPFICQ